MKKVLMLLSNGFNPDIRVHKEAKTLIDNGYSVTVLAWDRTKKLPKSEWIDGIRVKRMHLRSEYSNSFLNLFMIPASWICLFAEVITDEFDIVHCHDFDTLPPGFLAGKLRGKKVVYDAHESYPAQIEPKLPKPIVAIVSMAEALMSKNCNLVITVNEILGRAFRGRGGNVEVVMNCQRTGDYIVSEEKAKKLRKSINPKGDFLIVYIGGFTPERGLEEIIAALAKMKREKQKLPKLVLAGQGPLEKSLKGLVKANGLEEHISVLGFINPREVPLYSKAADAILAIYKDSIPNNYIAGPPNKLFEGMAAGRPIISSDMGELQRIVKESGCGVVVDPEDSESIISAISTLSNNKSFYKGLCVNSERACGQYNWSAMEKRLLTAYGKL